jgi:hypothetical protein
MVAARHLACSMMARTFWKRFHILTVQTESQVLSPFLLLHVNRYAGTMQVNIFYLGTVSVKYSHHCWPESVQGAPLRRRQRRRRGVRSCW